MVDTADCMTVRRDKCDVICQNCFQDLSKPIITCKGCNRAKFCGILCFRKGNDSFHKYECALWASMEETPHETLVMHSRAMLRMKIDQDFHDTIMALHHFDGPETMMESALELKKWSEAIKTHAPGMVPEGFDYPDIRRVYLAVLPLKTKLFLMFVAQDECIFHYEISVWQILRRRSLSKVVLAQSFMCSKLLCGRYSWLQNAIDCYGAYKCRRRTYYFL